LRNKKYEIIDNKIYENTVIYLELSYKRGKWMSSDSNIIIKINNVSKIFDINGKSQNEIVSIITRVAAWI